MTQTVAGYDSRRRLWRSIGTRLVLAALAWWIISEAQPGALAVGLPAVIAAAGLSLKLAPPGRFSLRFLPTLRFFGFFLYQSLVAGFDVARRILGPDHLRVPALRRVPLRLPPGPQRWLLADTLGLLPGTLIVELEADALLVHCLHEAMPVEREVRDLEQMMADMFGLTLAKASAR